MHCSQRTWDGLPTLGEEITLSGLALGTVLQVVWPTTDRDDSGLPSSSPTCSRSRCSQHARSSSRWAGTGRRRPAVATVRRQIAPSAHGQVPAADERSTVARMVSPRPHPPRRRRVQRCNDRSTIDRKCRQPSRVPGSPSTAELDHVLAEGEAARCKRRHELESVWAVRRRRTLTPATQKRFISAVTPSAISVAACFSQWTRRPVKGGLTNVGRQSEGALDGIAHPRTETSADSPYFTRGRVLGPSGCAGPNRPRPRI